MHRARARTALSLHAAGSIAAAIALAVLCLVALPGAAFAADVASLLVVTCAEEEPASALPPEQWLTEALRQPLATATQRERLAAVLAALRKRGGAAG